MTPPRITRRVALRQLGTGIGLWIVAAGCSGADSDGAASSAASGPPSTAATRTPAPGSTATPGQNTRWARVRTPAVSAFVLLRGGEAVLVDTGMPGTEDAVEGALTELGVSWDAIGTIIVTHHHPDHAGNLDAFAAMSPDAIIHVGAGDADAVRRQTEQPLQTVTEGDTVFDLQIIETPGHTPGHISVLERDAGLLVTGDALNTRGGELQSASADPDFTDDPAAADASVAKLAGLDYEIVLVGHGEPIASGGATAVTALAESL